MKTPTKFLSLFFLLFALTASPFPKPALADEYREPVFDIVGEAVLTNCSYYVYHYPIVDNVKALTLALVYDTCPLNVVLSEKPKAAFPLKFHPSKPDDDVVYASTNLNLEFQYKSGGDCERYSTVWSVARNSEQNMNYITTGGIVGSYGNLSTFNNWFKIVKPFPHENRYYFDFSSSIIDSICPCCQDSEIGMVSYPPGTSQLALSKEPLEVVFERVDINLDLK